MTAPKFSDIKNAQIPFTTASLIGFMIFVVNVSLWIGSKLTNTERDIDENKRSIKQLIEYNRIQDIKIQENHKKSTEFFTAIELIKNRLNTIGDDIKEIKHEKR